MKICPDCKSTISDTAKFCVRCGYKFNNKSEEAKATQEYFCSECGTRFSGGFFCPECGTNIESELGSFDSASSIDSFDFSELESEARKQLVEQIGLQIEGSVLIKYTGKSRTLEIPEGVTEIFDGALSGNEIVSSVTIPEGVTVIGRGAFKGCRYLKNVTIPSTVVEIYDEAFYGCGELEEVVLANRLTQIRQRVFGSCSKLRTITIPASLKTIDNYAFEFCRSLTDIYISDLAGWCTISGVAHLMAGKPHNKLFLNDELITNLEIPNSVSHISSYAFSGCCDIVNIDIPSSVQSIGDGAFSSCGITSISVLNSHTVLGNAVFSSCEKLEEAKIYTSIPGEEFYKKKPLFDNCPMLKTVTVGEGATSIGRCAFKDCTSLVSVTISDSVASIGDSAFFSCTSLEKVNIPNKLETIEPRAFLNCHSLKSISIPNSVSSIEREAFAGCKGLSQITIPDSVVKIGEEAFYNCTGLIIMSVPNSVQTIGCGAFKGCINLKKITLPFVGENASPQEYKNSHFGFIFGVSGSYDRYEGVSPASGLKLSSSYSFSSDSMQTTVERTGYYYLIPTSLKEVVITGGTSCAFSNCMYIERIWLPEKLYSRNYDYQFSCCNAQRHKYMG